MPEIPGDVVGVYKYVIGGLGTAVTGLVGAVVFQYREANKVNSSRLEERDKLNATITANTQVLESIKLAIDRRNSMMEELSRLITSQGAAFNLFIETMKLQQEMSDRDRAASIQAISAMAESIRVVTTKIDENARLIRDVLKEVES